MKKALIRLNEVERRTAIKRSEIYTLIRRGAFPRPVKIGLRAVAWIEEEIDAHVAAKIAAARGRPSSV
jgi:prophage regulatory protein